VPPASRKACFSSSLNLLSSEIVFIDAVLSGWAAFLATAFLAAFFAVAIVLLDAPAADSEFALIGWAEFIEC